MDDFSDTGTTTTFDPGTWSDPGMSWPSYDPGAGPGGVSPGYSDPWSTPGAPPTGDPNVYDQGGAGGWLSELEKLMQGNTAKSLMSAGGGIYGLLQGRNLQDMSKTAFGQSNPFGQYREIYGQQLMNLMANPGSIVNDPGYKFAFGQGQQAVERSAAARGFLGSGNEAIALQEYGMGFANDYLHQQEQFLSGLAGSGITPNFGASLGGYGAGADISGQAINALAYGTTRFGGASAGTPGAARPSSAGGEAAIAVGLAGKGIGLYNTLAGAAGGSKIPTGAGTVGGAVGAANDLLGIYSGMQKGGVGGYAKAGLSATDLATKAGLFGGAKGALGSTLGKVTPFLGLYSGLKQGGPLGYGQAALSTYQLAQMAGLAPASAAGAGAGAGAGATAGGTLGTAAGASLVAAPALLDSLLRQFTSIDSPRKETVLMNNWMKGTGITPVQKPLNTSGVSSGGGIAGLKDVPFDTGQFQTATGSILGSGFNVQTASDLYNRAYVDKNLWDKDAEQKYLNYMKQYEGGSTTPGANPNWRTGGPPSGLLRAIGG